MLVMTEVVLETILLGTSGGGLLVPHRHLMSTVVVVEGEPVLFDIGEGATRQLQKAGIPPTQVKHLFFTHHHLDHITDYVYFVFSTWLDGREQNLKVFGPPEIERMTEMLFGEQGVYRQDQIARYAIKGSQQTMQDRTGHTLSKIKIDVDERDTPSWEYDGGVWKVTAVKTQHVDPYMDTYAYRLDADQGSVVIAEDSAPTQAVIELAQGADLLVHECSATKEVVERYGYQELHTWPEAVAEIATKADVKRLALVHFFRQTDTPETLAQIKATIREAYQGEIFMGEDLLRITLS